MGTVSIHPNDYELIYYRNPARTQGSIGLSRICFKMASLSGHVIQDKVTICVSLKKGQGKWENIQKGAEK